MQNVKLEKQDFQDINYSFIEYMSYCLKKYGKKAYGYLKILEEETEKRYLPTDYLAKVKADIQLKERLQFARLVFLFSYYC